MKLRMELEFDIKAKTKTEAIIKFKRLLVKKGINIYAYLVK